MTKSSSALEMLRLKTRYEFFVAAADAARAIAAVKEAEQQALAEARRVDAHSHELRDALTRTAMNPALIQALQTIQRAAQASLHTCLSRHQAVSEHEEQMRQALAELRNTERSLERAVQAQRRNRQLESQTREMAVVDDMWSQHMSRISS
jgi:hypothetical protein